MADSFLTNEEVINLLVKVIAESITEALDVEILSEAAIDYHDVSAQAESVRAILNKAMIDHRSGRENNLNITINVTVQLMTAKN